MSLARRATGGSFPLSPSVVFPGAHCSNSSSNTRSQRRRLSTAQCLESNATSQWQEVRRLQSTYAQERAEEREIFHTILSGSPSKRAANSYLKRFAPTSTPKDAQKVEAGSAKQKTRQQWIDEAQRLDRTGVNLGNLYKPPKAVVESPVFTQHPLPEQLVSEQVQPTHVALVKLRAPQLLDDDTLGGIALTLSQLVHLGLSVLVVVDCDHNTHSQPSSVSSSEWRRFVKQQADRVVAGLRQHNKPGALVLSDAVGLTTREHDTATHVRVQSDLTVLPGQHLLSLLQGGTVPVVTPLAVTSDASRMVTVDADSVMLALTRHFAGITSSSIQHLVEAEPESLPVYAENAIHQTHVDRVIVLDPLGGIPSEDQQDKAHIFLNLDQEYDTIRAELESTSQTPAASQSKSSARHVQNLDVVEQALRLLPPSSSALILSPSETAVSAQLPATQANATSVRTRLQRNPLIHNLLTDKPMVSSSLPAGPRSAQTSTPTRSVNPPTFVKKGMPLTIIPDPSTDPWLPPGPSGSSLSLEDPRIDFPRLLHLIEDSFNRPLDVQHYLARIRNRLAGVIIAGEYEGGAILTWETPPHSPDEPTPEPVPYLDKFAVLKRSQGSGGVADIVFKAMVRSCFPDGVCWRSRKNNPVNKWYFERSVGTWKIDGGLWTMFWTTPDLEQNEKRWREYEAVCKGVLPSWKDNKQPD